MQSCLAENGRKSQHNLSTGQKKVPKGQFLKASQNWQKSSALVRTSLHVAKEKLLICAQISRKSHVFAIGIN
jgi:hypothetical protein